MRAFIWMEIKSVLLAWTIAVALPLLVFAADRADGNSDLALASLGLGCVLLAVKAFGSNRPNSGTEIGSEGGRLWIARASAVLITLLCAAAVFVSATAAYWDPGGLPLPLVVGLTLAPGWGIAPYLTVRTRKRFAAVVFTAFSVCLIKLASCVVVRIIYGPDALADGYMAGDWQTAKLMISLFWIGTVTLSVVLAIACRRRLKFDSMTATS